MLTVPDTTVQMLAPAALFPLGFLSQTAMDEIPLMSSVKLTATSTCAGPELILATVGVTLTAVRTGGVVSTTGLSTSTRRLATPYS
ncbi:hypothetical protein CSC94_11500 [Zhengella mangrovi]|uniref:Uncharacterized protein n=1 Tax=Zhengella mangrovi TaxID=1982044 RepID=A0A2G1QMK2_9HYPH|nr:hypothetical protein CSC94_11500 [Zhengella mangrovi]